MRPAARKETPRGKGIALVVILLATDISHAVAAENAPPSIRAEEARLAPLKMKKMETIQRPALLQEKTGGSTRLLRGSAGSPADRGFPPYSGALLPSFYDATRFAPGILPYSSFGIIFIRLFFTAVSVLAFFFPMLAIEKGTVRLRQKGRRWIACYRSKMKKHSPAAGHLQMKKAL